MGSNASRISTDNALMSTSGAVSGGWKTGIMRLLSNSASHIRDRGALKTTPGHALQLASTGMSPSHFVTRIVGFFICAWPFSTGEIVPCPRFGRGDAAIWAFSRICTSRVLRGST